MNITQYAEQFWRDGYLVIENFFDADRMNHLNEMILQHFGLTPNWEHSEEFIQKAATEVIPWFPVREGMQDFEQIGKHADFEQLTQAILGNGWQGLYCMVMFSKQGTKGQAWHQDCPPENSQQFNLNRLVYTHDITQELGGQTIVYPGSHKLGELPVGLPHEDLENQVVLTPKKGTIVFLHGHTWHRVLPIKGTYRVSTNYRAVPKNTPEDITDVAVYRNMRYRFSTSEVVEERV